MQGAAASRAPTASVRCTLYTGRPVCVAGDAPHASLGATHRTRACPTPSPSQPSPVRLQTRALAGRQYGGRRIYPARVLCTPLAPHSPTSSRSRCGRWLRPRAVAHQRPFAASTNSTVWSPERAHYVPGTPQRNRGVSPTSDLHLPTQARHLAQCPLVGRSRLRGSRYCG